MLPTSPLSPVTAPPALQEYVASDYSCAEESEGAAEEEDDGSAVDHDPRRRARKMRSPTSRDTKRCGPRRPDDDPDPLLAAETYQPERWRRDPRQQEDGVRSGRRVRANRNNGLEQDMDEDQEQEPPAAEVDEYPGPRTGGRPGRRPRFSKQARSDDVASPPPPRRRRDDDVAANMGVGEGENAEMVWKDYEEVCRGHCPKHSQSIAMCRPKPETGRMPLRKLHL